ncbi:adhesin [Providencia sp. JUb39]|nr:adhesin [Providencia sp. JUb39]
MSLFSHANYAPKIANPSEGYKIKLSSNSSIAQTPVTGSDGKPYYQVGNSIVIDQGIASVSGMVKCVGRVWGDSGYNDFSSDNAYHRLFMYAPTTGIVINGLPAYRINNNVVMTVQSKMSDWVHIGGSSVCAYVTYIDKSDFASGFGVHFPMTFTFYINEKIIDGQIMIAGMELAGYVRAFMNPLVKPNISSWPFNETSAPVHLETSQLNVGSSCTTSTSTGQVGTVTLRHGQLNALKYDNKVTEKVNYTCKFSALTKVRLRLDYAADSDPQKRLPLINKVTKEKIYTTLMMTDDSTGKSGLDMNVDIDKLKTISISSHLQGTNAPAGDYQGSAWLIATFI